MFESEPFVACLSEKRGGGGDVTVSPNWLTLSLDDRCGVLRKRRRRRRKGRDGGRGERPKGIQRGDKDCV